MKKWMPVSALILVLLATLVTVSVMAADEAGDSWTGEVIDVACYSAKGAAGEEHAGCAKACVKNGQPMGLLLADDSVVILAADHESGDAFTAAKELAGQKAEIAGSISEKGGVKVLTVTAAKPAA